MDCGLFDRVLVSTDSDEIMQVAVACGAEVPFIRPSELSDDTSPTRVVVNHAINWVTEHQHQPQQVCCLYATAPFVTGDILASSWRQWQNSGKAFCFSVASYPYPIQRALMMQADGSIAMFHPEHRLSRSQDLTPAYHDAGQFYWGTADAFLTGKIMYSNDATAYIVPRYQVQDIDTEEDWVFAERLFRAGVR